MAGIGATTEGSTTRRPTTGAKEGARYSGGPLCRTRGRGLPQMLGHPLGGDQVLPLGAHKPRTPTGGTCARETIPKSKAVHADPGSKDGSPRLHARVASVAAQIAGPKASGGVGPTAEVRGAASGHEQAVS